MQNKIVIEIEDNSRIIVTFEKKDITYPICTITDKEFVIDERTHPSIIDLVSSLITNVGGTLYHRFKDLTANKAK